MSPLAGESKLRAPAWRVPEPSLVHRMSSPCTVKVALRSDFYLPAMSQMDCCIRWPYRSELVAIRNIIHGFRASENMKAPSRSIQGLKNRIVERKGEQEETLEMKESE